MQKGLVCSLTGEKASFENECPDFNLDESVKTKLDDSEPLEQQEVRRKLHREALEKLKLDQNLTKAIVAGLRAYPKIIEFFQTMKAQARCSIA